MSTTLPVLFLDDAVVLPGMVLPIELTSQAQASIDAARAARGGARSNDLRDHDQTRDSAPLRLLLVPRIDGRTGVIGTIAEVTQIGRLPSGEPAAVLRATDRARIGTGVPGPGAALWVEAETVEAPAPTGRGRGARRRVQARAHLDPAAAPGLPGDRHRAADERPRGAGRRRGLRRLDRDGGQAPPARDRRRGRAAGVPARARQGVPRRDGGQPRGSRRRPRGHGEDASASTCCASSSRPSARSSASCPATATARPRPTTAAGSRRPTCPRPSARQPSARPTSSSAPPTQSPEGGWIRTWLDTVLELPWGTRTTDTADVAAARAVLDADHTGLDDVKDRIVEYLAVRARRAERGMEVVGGRGSGAVLALVGPPGVGKTSLGESVARALGRNFVRVALGGVRDEAEIRGHRRTYVGALPGRIVRAIKEAGSMNPVVLLDEVDKVGSDYRGDPAAALLEVLDPAQNHTFRDHYLELDLDLSDVVFLATANVAETIPERAARPDGGRPARRLHRGREGRDRPRPPAPPPARARRPDRRRGRADRRGAAAVAARAHPRGRRPAARARSRQDPAQGRRAARGGHRRRHRSRSTLEGVPHLPRPAALHARSPPSGPPCPASPPASR